MNLIARASLYFSEGRSDKEYHAEIVEVAGGHFVNFRYGRRGGTLTVGTKTATPVDGIQAKAIFAKLLKEKLAKGYTPDSSGAAYQGSEQAGRKTDFVPQLPNPLSERQAMDCLSDPCWAAQEKIDGERRAAHAQPGHVIGANRKGLTVPLPQPIADQLQAIAARQGALRVDGELVGDTLYVFDLHVHQGQGIHTLPWSERMGRAAAALAGCDHLKPIPVAESTDQKRGLWNRVKSACGEGVVFKRMSAPVGAGRPHAGGDWLKFKFTESASCLVIDSNIGKRSVRIGLLDNAKDSGEITVPVGNVTIPPNHGIPAAGEIIEVGYLYAYPGGSLYQPVYRGKRGDVDRRDCTLDQLKFTAKESRPCPSNPTPAPTSAHPAAGPDPSSRAATPSCPGSTSSTARSAAAAGSDTDDPPSSRVWPTRCAAGQR